MEKDLKGLLVFTTLILLFITALLNFIVIFPFEQGVTFTGEGGEAYSKISALNETVNIAQLEAMNNASDSAFNNWDITVGFMGSNTMSQSSKANSQAYKGNIFTSLITIAGIIFDYNSPIFYAILTISLMSTTYIIYLAYKFVRNP